MEETKKKNIVPIIVIVAGVLLVVVGAVFMLTKGNSDAKAKEKEKENTVDEHEVKEDVLKKLVKVAFISDDEKNTYTSPLDGVEGNIDELDIAKKVEIVLNYAKEAGLAVEEKDSSKCVSGNGTCNSITLDNYKKAIKLYGLDSLKAEDDSTVKLDNNKYYFRGFEKEIKYKDTMHNYFSMKLLDEIIINDNIHIMDINSESEEINDTMINKEYTFRQIEGTEDYYLYSVRDNTVVR